MPVVRFNGKKLDPATIKALVSGTLVNGSKPTVWWNRQSIDFRNNFMDTMRTSMRNGESLNQAITRVVGGTVDGVSVPGIMTTTKARAGALAATAQSAVTNEAALNTFQQNNDVIKAVSQVSTLDNKTSDICVAYSGQTWDVNTLQPVMGGTLPFNGGPPRHFNCRSRLRPVTKSFKELGVDKAEIPPGTRASMDGQVPSDLTFNQFLKSKPNSFADDLLGPKRAQLYRDGDITLTQLVDMRGNPMSLRQLEDLVGIKPKPKFNPATSKIDDVAKPKPKKKTVDSFLENDDGSFVQITQAQHDEITGHAKRLVSAADDADAVVTQQIKSMADDVGAAFPDAPIVKDGPDVFEGSLHWRKKDLESTSRKIQTYARDKNLTFTEASDAISDSLRYTFIIEDAEYMKGVQRAMERFVELGYKNGKFDASWFKRPDYRGININMITPDGVKMELQFHTAKSFEIKNGVNHTLYEKFRKLSTAKQEGKVGQALQAEMKKNADTIPLPDGLNKESLKKLSDRYSFKTPTQTLKQATFDDALKAANKKLADAQALAKKLQDEAKAATKISKAQNDFEIKLNQHLDEGNVGKATIDIGKNLDLPDDVLKAANDRVAALRVAQTKKLDDIIKELDKINDASAFGEALGLAREAAEPGIKQQLSKAGNDLFQKKLHKEFAENAVNKAIDEGDIFFARQQLHHLDDIEARKKLTLTITRLEKAAVKDAKDAFGLFSDIEFSSQDEFAAWVKSIRPGLKTKASDKEFMKLVDEGSQKIKSKIAMKDAQVAIDKGDLGEAKSLLVNATGDDVGKMQLKIANLRHAESVSAKKMVDDLAALFPEEGALIEAVEIAIKDAKPTFGLFAENHLAAAVEKLENIKLAKIKNFPQKVKNAVQELGFSEADVGLLSMSLEDLAILKNGVFDDALVASLRKQIGGARTVLRMAQEKITALNKAAKGVDAITDVANELPIGIKLHPEFQAAIKKVTKQAQKKANLARQDVLDTMIKAGQLEADDIGKFSNVLTDAMRDVNKKLGTAQKKAKIAEIRAKIASAKKNNDVSIAEFVADGTDYDKTVLKMLEGESVQQQKLNDAIQLFKKNGDDPQARSKLFDMLQGRTKSEQRALKEFVHKRVNPKSLATGQNWDSAIADVVTRHANNASASDIQKYISSLTDGLTDGMKTNFNQTIFTRAGVKSIDDLGVVLEGEATPTVLRIRKELKIKDKGNERIPEHTAKEQLEAAKSWLNSGNTTNTDFFAQSKRTHNTMLKQSRRTIKDGDRKFGDNSWGITPDEWDDWVKNVAPTLDDWDIALINQYTGGMAGNINAGLYNGGFQTIDTAGARALNSALDKMPKHTGTVYRGTNSRANWSADFVDARYEVGKTVTERGFGSSATQESAAFSGPIRFIIHTKGKQGAIMGHLGGYGTKEMEVLFKAGSKFRVLRKRRNGNSITVTMEEV